MEENEWYWGIWIRLKAWFASSRLLSRRWGWRWLYGYLLSRYVHEAHIDFIHAGVISTYSRTFNEFLVAAFRHLSISDVRQRECIIFYRYFGGTHSEDEDFQGDQNESPLLYWQYPSPSIRLSLAYCDLDVMGVIITPRVYPIMSTASAVPLEPITAYVKMGRSKLNRIW